MKTMSVYCFRVKLAFVFSTLFLSHFLLASTLTELKMVDSNATKETKELFQHLLSYNENGLFFGHQNANIEGVGWFFKGAPDIYRVTQKYPKVYGFDFIELRRGISLESFKNKIVEAYHLGAIITLSWHQNNPLTNKDYQDNTGTIDKIFSSKQAMSNLHKDLDKVANFFKSLRDRNGKLIPVIFRPLHESNGEWFWWGKGNQSDYLYLWRHYVWYLRDKSKVRNLIYAYSPAYLSEEGRGYWSRYPGDEWVDVLGYEHYIDTSRLGEEMDTIKGNIKRLTNLAKKKRKPLAITEIGTRHNTIPSKFWTESFLKLIIQNNLSKDLTYVLFWRNDNPTHRFVPYPGDASENDFKIMSSHPSIIFIENNQ